MCHWYEQSCFQLCLHPIRWRFNNISTLQSGSIQFCADILTRKLSNMLTWSSNNNLAFNAIKRKAILFTISQMEKLHGLEQDVVKLKWKDKTLQNVHKFKLLAITIGKNLNWKKQINNTTKNCCATLRVLRKIKIYKPLPVRKQLAEFLILSKLDYCSELLFGIPKYMKQQLHRWYKMQHLVSF